MREVRHLSGQAAILALFVAVALLPATPAWAYLGPGAGISAIGAVIAFIGALFLAVIGFLWFPLKRLFAAGAKKQSARSGGSDD